MDKLKRTYEEIGQLRSQCSTLTVLQWNVLADGLAQNGDFQRVMGGLKLPSLIMTARLLLWIKDTEQDSAERLCCSRCPNRYLLGRGGPRKSFRR